MLKLFINSVFVNVEIDTEDRGDLKNGPLNNGYNGDHKND